MHYHYNRILTFKNTAYCNGIIYQITNIILLRINNTFIIKEKKRNRELSRTD